MEKIVVNDTNIFIDLYKIGLLEEMFSLPWEIHTTRLVLVEIIREGQQESVNLYVNDGRLHIPELSEEEMLSIAKMKLQYSGADGKKIWEIHTTDHKGLGPHYHKWKDGKPLDEEPHPLTPAMKKLLDNVSNLS